MKKINIGTLTHDAPNRDKFLKLTINTFMENTNVPECISWFIYINGGYDSPVILAIREMTEKWGDKVNFHIFCEGKNMGVGYGINRLNEWLKFSEFSLFLEGDWITLPESLSGCDKNWLVDCVNLLETNKEIDQVQLRRFQHDVDDRQFGYGHWIRPNNIKDEDDKFIYLNQREYGNNPTVRRNSTHFEHGIFPLQEFIDDNGEPQELKGNPLWGQAEIVASRIGKEHLGTAFLKFGNFVHCDHWKYDDDFERASNDIKGCGFKTNSLVNCKYGYMYPSEAFCLACRKSKNYTDLEEHNWFYEYNVHKAFWSKESKETIKEILSKNIDTTPVDIDEYIDNAYKNMIF